MSQKRKVVIVGAGRVGAHCAYATAAFGVCEEIVLVDLNEPMAQGQATDIADGVACMYTKPIVRHGTYADCADADIVAVTAGAARQPGQTRLDVMALNVKIMKSIAPAIMDSGFNGIIVVISNPADIITDLIQKLTGLPKNRVFSTGTMLDSARLIKVLSEIYGINASSINAFCMGEHGDSQMIPFSQASVSGIPFLQYAPNPDRETILERTKKMGAQIIGGKGSTEFGIGTTFAFLAKAILEDEKKVLSVSAYLDGEYGHKEVYIGVPCVVGRNGIEKVLEVEMTAEEKEAFDASAEVLKKNIAMVDDLLKA